MQSHVKISKIHINGPNPPLLQYPEEFKMFKDLNKLCSFDFPLTGFDKRKSGRHLSWSKIDP